MTKSTLWIETWIDSSANDDFLYLLVLREREDGSLEVVDPQKNGEIIRTFDQYEHATIWLREDEYDLVEGRWFVIA